MQSIEDVAEAMLCAGTEKVLSQSLEGFLARAQQLVLMGKSAGVPLEAAVQAPQRPKRLGLPELPREHRVVALDRRLRKGFPGHGKDRKNLVGQQKVHEPRQRAFA